VEELIAKLQADLWLCAGLLRSGEELARGKALRAQTAAALNTFATNGKMSRRLAEGLSLVCVAESILKSALARTESRGAHFREDCPERDDQHFQKHSVFERGVVRFE
jgi:succinate dehydrogenase/fumarate reductase flavoprotein subunit